MCGRVFGQEFDSPRLHHLITRNVLYNGIRLIVKHSWQWGVLLWNGKDRLAAKNCGENKEMKAKTDTHRFWRQSSWAVLFSFLYNSKTRDSAFGLPYKAFRMEKSRDFCATRTLRIKWNRSCGLGVHAVGMACRRKFSCNFRFFKYISYLRYDRICR